MLLFLLQFAHSLGPNLGHLHGAVRLRRWQTCLLIATLRVPLTCCISHIACPLALWWISLLVLSARDAG